MINDNAGEKANLSRKNYLLVDVELLQKEELAQRRKLRIQQVRLQSKDISNKILQDVRNERNRQLKLIQNKQADLFKKWHARKLYEINLKYKDNISRLGSSYQAAAAEPDPEKELLERSKKNSAIAQARGRKAIDLLKTEQELSRSQQNKLTVQRDNVKKLEGIRSALVSSLPTRKNGSSESQQREQAEVLEEQRDVHMVTELQIEEPPTGRRSESRHNPSSHRTVSCLDLPPVPLVEVYDRSNPCTVTQRQPPSVRVERTSPQSQTNAREAAELEEKIEAKRHVKEENEEEIRQKRGKKALAKEMVRRDFDRLINRLGGLAREECIVRGSAPPTLPKEMYMDEGRCALRAQLRQRNMDFAFEGVFYGNKGAEKKEVSSVEEVSHPHPLVVEQVVLPESWQGVKLLVPKPPETYPQKLNVGICDKVTESLPASGLVARSIESSTDSTMNVSKTGSNEFCHSETLKEPMPCEKLPEQDKPYMLPKESSDVTSVPENVLPTKIKAPEASMEPTTEMQLKVNDCISTAKHGLGADKEKEIPIDGDLVGGPVWWCSLITEKATTQHVTPGRMAPEHEQDEYKHTELSSDTCIEHETIPRTEICRHTFELRNHQESHPNIENSLCLHRKDSSSVTYETEGSHVDSSSPSSVNIEEVRVVVRLNNVSPKKVSVEEEKENIVGLPYSQRASTHTTLRQKRRTVGQEQQKKNLVVDNESTAKTADAPDAAPLTLKDKKRVDDVTVIPDDSATKPERKKRRDRKDLQRKKKGFLLPGSDSSYLSPPSHLEVSGTGKTKALLKEIRLQRRQLEKWAGLKENDDGKMPAQLGEYVQKLLSMTRESVAELSVSDASTPSHGPSITMPIDKRESTPSLEREVEEENLVTMCNKVKQEVNAMSLPAKSLEKEGSWPKLQEIMKDFTIDEGLRSSSVIKPTKTSSMKRSMPSTITLNMSSLQGMETAEHHPPVPPPPSPEYEELSVLHSYRISQLGAKLMEVRKVQRKLLSPSSSSNRDTQKSSSSSIVSSTEKTSSSSEKSAKKSNEYVPGEERGRKSWDGISEESDVRRSWEMSDISTTEDSEDISLLGNILLKSLPVIEQKQSSKKLQVETIATRRSENKAGPPPTSMRGMDCWKSGVYQIPHELSTITEVDSKLISALSMVETRKEKDSATSVGSIRSTLNLLDLSDDSISEKKSIPIDHPKRTSVLFPEQKLVSGQVTSGEWVGMTSHVDGKPSSAFVSLEPTSENVDNLVKIATKPLLSKSKFDIALTSSSSSSEEDTSGSSKFPENLDDALRMLGISPTILKRPHSPIIRSPEPKKIPLAGEMTHHSTPIGTTKDFTLGALLYSPFSKAKVEDVEVLEPVRDFGSHGPEQVSFTSREMPQSMQSHGIRKSSSDSKEIRTPVSMLHHSTPVHSISAGTSSSSDSYHKSNSGFPFLGESAPSSISGGGTPAGAEWRNIDDDVVPKKDAEG